MSSTRMPANGRVAASAPPTVVAKHLLSTTYGFRAMRFEALTPILLAGNMKDMVGIEQIFANFNRLEGAYCLEQIFSLGSSKRKAVRSSP
jgi:hypothetical protein